MDRLMTEQARIDESRNMLFERHFDYKKQYAQQKANARAEKIRIVQQLARDCGVDPRNAKLWCTVLKITEKDDTMEFFIGTPPDARLGIIEYLANVNN
jgi:hypothetical protein